MADVHNGLEPRLDEKDLARITRCSLASVRRWRLLKQGPPFQKIGTSVRYDPADVRAWLASRPRGGGQTGVGR